MKKALLPVLIAVAVGAVASPWLARLEPGAEDAAEPVARDMRPLESTAPAPKLTGATGSPPDEVVRPGVHVTVEVRLHETDAPMAGIRVRGSWFRTLGEETPGVDGKAIATTDASGRVRFGPLPDGPLRVFAHALHCVAKGDSVDVVSPHGEPQADPVLDVRLRGTLSFRGRVYGQDGTPAAGCFLSVQPCVDGKRQWEGAFAKTDADGAFRFDGLDADDVFSVRAWAGFEANDAEGWTLARPGQEDVRIDLHAEDTDRPATPFSARIVGADGEPVPEFRVAMRGDRPDEVELLVERGRISCSGVHGPCWVHLWDARDEKERPLPLGPVFAGPLDPRCGEHTIVLPAEAVYTGHVVDPRGNPVAGAKLTAQPWSASIDRPSKHEALDAAVTAVDGSFRLGRLPQGKVRVFIEPPAGFAHYDPWAVVGGKRDATVRVSDAVRVRLKIVGEDGRPLSGIGVSACVPDRGMGVIISHAPLPGIVTGDRTAEDGMAVLNGLDATRAYILRVNWGLRFTREDVLSHVDETWRPADGVITLSTAHTLSGCVVNADGEPVSDAPFRITWGEDLSIEFQTDSAGAFRYASLPSGTHRVEVWAPGADTEDPPAASTSARAGSRDVKIILPAAAK